MDHFDAETAVALINDYWPGTLDNAQVTSWARVISKQRGADFDQTCHHIAHLAANQPNPPRLADICAAIKPALQPAAEAEDTGPPVDRTRGQAWAAHTSAIGRLAAARKEQHDHRNGWERCPICTQPGTYTQCGNPTCPVCAA